MSKPYEKPCLSLVALLSRYEPEELPPSRERLQRIGQQSCGPFAVDRLQERWFYPRHRAVMLKLQQFS